MLSLFPFLSAQAPIHRAPGDFDGDGKSDAVVWRPVNANWYQHASSGASPNPLTFGLPGDIPVWGDFDGDGKADYAVWRPATATWLVLKSSTNTAATPVTFGIPGDIPIPGDFNGDGITDYAVWRP